MKRWLIILFLLVASPAWASDLCFNFRATAGFVTDIAPCVPVLGEQAPTLFGNGITGGWLAAANTRDRSTGVDVRVAGENHPTNVGDTLTFTLDAAESKDIRLALGDQANAHTNLRFELYDNTTLFATIGPVSPGANQYYDATGVLRTSDSDWATNNALLTRVFTTTTFILKPTGGSATNSDYPIAHLRVTTTPGGAVTPMRTLTGVGS